MMEKDIDSLLEEYGFHGRGPAVESFLHELDARQFSAVGVIFRRQFHPFRPILEIYICDRGDQPESELSSDEITGRHERLSRALHPQIGTMLEWVGCLTDQQFQEAIRQFAIDPEYNPSWIRFLAA